jgi:hypothetical protein
MSHKIGTAGRQAKLRGIAGDIRDALAGVDEPKSLWQVEQMIDRHHGLIADSVALDAETDEPWLRAEDVDGTQMIDVTAAGQEASRRDPFVDTAGSQRQIATDGGTTEVEK